MVQTNDFREGRDLHQATPTVIYSLEIAYPQDPTIEQVVTSN